MFQIHRLAVIMAVLVSVGMFAGSALGTPGSGVSSTILARGTTAEKIKIKADEMSDVIVQRLTIQPGGHTGWHSHPGPVVVVVANEPGNLGATVTLYDGGDRSCTPKVYTAGQVVIDPGDIHIARNEGTVPVVLYGTFFDVPEGAPSRIDVSPAPGNCPF